MAAPAALGAIGMGMNVAGGALGVFGALSKGNADASMFNYQAGVAQLNAKIARENSDYTLATGETQQQMLGMKQAQQMGKIKVAQAASGLDINAGSAAEVRSSQEMINRMDQQQLRENIGRTAYNYRVQAASQDASAEMYRSAASNAKKSGMINALASVVGTASSVSDKWFKGTQSGMFGSGGGSGITLYGPDQNVTGYIA